MDFILFLPFLEEITGFSGCFIAFIVKKLLFLLKKKETIKVKGGKAVIFFKAQGKTWITLPLLTKKDNTVLSECLLHLSEKSYATQFPQSWHLKAVLCLFCNLNKTFFKQGKKKMKVFFPQTKPAPEDTSCSSAPSDTSTQLTVPSQKLLLLCLQRCTFPSALHC